MILALLITLNMGVPIHALNCDINWRTETELNRYTLIQSYKQLTPKQIDKIRSEVIRTALHFELFTHSMCNRERLIIRIISSRDMNNIRCFDNLDTDYTYYGRYYRADNVIYLTLEVLKNPEVLWHEVFHYMYDVCGYNMSEAEQHKNIDVFVEQMR